MKKLEGNYYIVMTYSGSYDDYHDSYWEVHESILPFEEAITEYFIKAEEKQERKLAEYRRKHKAILMKHGRSDLVIRKFHCTFTADSPFAIQRKVSEECKEELRELEKEFPMDVHWEKYVEEVSHGRIRPFKPNLKFEWKERWDREK